MLLTNDTYLEKPSIPRYKHMSATIIHTALPPFMDQVQRSPSLSWITNIIPAIIGMSHFHSGPRAGHHTVFKYNNSYFLEFDIGMDDGALSGRSRRVVLS
jgi:hypothetical protein